VSNHLSEEKQALVVAALCEGVGIRATARIVDVNRETVGKLALAVGEGCARLHDTLFVRLAPARVELDEAWSFVHTKQAKLKEDDNPDYGDQYSFVALDADTKAVIAYHVGKRTAANTQGFLLDLASRVTTKPQITTDGLSQYVKAVARAFGPDADYAMCIKEYLAACSVEASRRYSPAEAVHVERIRVSGEPDDAAISTAYVERQNLTLRMLTRRFTRLTNGFSKVLRNHRAAMDMYVGYYNLCWVHETLAAGAVPRTPAMAAGVARERWDVARFTRECLVLALAEPARVTNPAFDLGLQDRFRSRRRAWL
jgi:IS1 family transposase